MTYGRVLICVQPDLFYLWTRVLFTIGWTVIGILAGFNTRLMLYSMFRAHNVQLEIKHCVTRVALCFRCSCRGRYIHSSCAVFGQTFYPCLCSATCWALRMSWNERGQTAQPMTIVFDIGLRNRLVLPFYLYFGLFMIMQMVRQRSKKPTTT